MKIVVVGGTGFIGSKVVANLLERGHEAVAASPDTGVNTFTGEGVADAFRGADVVVDVTNAPSWEDQAVLDFFVTSTRNQLAAEEAAGVKHHVALSIVGADQEPDSGYLRAKVAQEKLIKDSGRPYTILRSTQFFEFVRGIADASADGDTIRLTNALFQPIAGDDVAAFVTDTALAPAANHVLEIGGPEAIPLDGLARRALARDGDLREVITDPDARYYGAKVKERSLTPGPDARLGRVTFDDWLTRRDSVPS
jgi:uncharacterized protein YbjT (DUF2867 family)